MRFVNVVPAGIIAAAAGLVVNHGLSVSALASPVEAAVVPPVSAVGQLVEVAECFGSLPSGVVPEVGSAGGQMTQTVSLTILPTALVKTDSLGRPFEVMTNTGCAPRSGDMIYVFVNEGELRQVPWSNFASVIWHGDFSRSGEWVPQT